MIKRVTFTFQAILLLSLSLLVVACSQGAEVALEPTEPAGEDVTQATEVPAETDDAEPDDAQPDDTEEDAQPAAADDDRPMVPVRLYSHDMQQLDPAFLSRQGDWWIANNIYSGLVRWKLGTPEVEPDLATDWEVSEDGTEITFYLREGVMWHKGYGEVTADDVKFSFDRILDPETGSPFNEAMSIIDSIEVVDKYTVKLILTEPSATLLTSILPYRPGYIVPQKAVEEMGQEEFSLNPVGSGPFIFDHWVPASEVVLLANDEYYAGPPQIAGLRLLPITDENAAVIGLQAGEILYSIIGTPESNQILQQDPNVEVRGQTGTLARYIYLHNQREPTDDVLVRRALQHAIDREAISEFGYEGIHPPMMTIFMPTFLCYTEDVPVYEYDPEKARELLAEAGYEDGFSLTMLYSQRPEDQVIAELVQEMWGQIGVELEITGLEHGTYTEIRRDPERREDFDVIIAHIGRTTDPHSYLVEALHGSSFPPGNNGSYYDNADQLIDAAAVEMDPEQRCEIYEEIQQQVQEDAPVIPIVHTALLEAGREELNGWGRGTNAEFWAYPFSVEE